MVCNDCRFTCDVFFREEEEEESIDNIAGVNLKVCIKNFLWIKSLPPSFSPLSPSPFLLLLQEETAHFLPATSDTPTQSITDETFLSTSLLKSKVKLIGEEWE